MADQDVIEAHELDRRRTLAVFLWGSQSGVRTRHTEAVRGLLLGAALALVIVLVVGVVALVQASRARNQRSALGAPVAAVQEAVPISVQAAASTAAS